MQKKTSTFWAVVMLILLSIIGYGTWLRYGTEKGQELQIKERATLVHTMYGKTKYDFIDIGQQTELNRQNPLSRMIAREQQLDDLVGDLEKIKGLPENLEDEKDETIKQAQTLKAFSLALRKFASDGNPRWQQQAKNLEIEYLKNAPKTPKVRVGTKVDQKFKTCKAAQEAGFGPYRQGFDPEYSYYEDNDGDGTVCDT